MPDEERTVIRSLAELATPQIQAVLSRAVIKGEVAVTHPPIDLVAIEARAAKLAPLSQERADIYALLIELSKR